MTKDSDSLRFWNEYPEWFPFDMESFIDIGNDSKDLISILKFCGIDAERMDSESIYMMEWDKTFDFGICINAMEHVPKERIMQSLRRIQNCCKEVLFKIEGTKPSQWWIKQMNHLGGEAFIIEVTLIKWKC